MMKKFILLFGLLPMLTFSQLESAYSEMVQNKDNSFEEYQTLVAEAAKYLITNPVNTKSSEFIAASKIITHFPDTESSLEIRENGKFYKSLASKENQIVYRAALLHYFMDQRSTHGRLLMGLEITGQKLHEQKDYKEIQLGAATIFLNHASISENNITLNKEATKYLEALKKNKLEKMQF